MPRRATVRPYRRGGDVDWWAVRDLLVRTHGVVGRGWNWDIRRWDGLRFHNEVPELPDHVAAATGCWEDDAGRLVGVVHPEGGGDPFLEVDPAWRHLEPEMLAWAEAHVARPADGRRIAEVLAWDWDEPRRALLAERGYVEQPDGWWSRWTDLARPVEVPRTPHGYLVRTTGEATFDQDAARMASLLNAAFRRSIHTADEYRQFMQGAPAFRHDLNLVAVGPDGSFAAHVGAYLDPVNAHGVFEPVCTHPDHRRQGLARILLLEGLRRLRGLGAVSAAVDTGDMAEANAFYRALGFAEEHRAHAWRRDLGPV
jgi:ribosomal protein S18 acetylase RimI-like enzyme